MCLLHTTDLPKMALNIMLLQLGRSILSAVFILLGIYTATTYANDPVVTVEQGQIIGKRINFEAKELNFERQVHAYLGIPYAEAPIGSLRFKPPVPKEWKGEIRAQEFGKVCPQMYVPFIPLDRESLDEDCLVLNVHVPIPTPPNAAVMLFIHGGGYAIGTGAAEFWDWYPMAALGDVIVVTINYRLGLLGFLATGDDVIPGNMGLLDQLEAMKWVQKNIAAFGGDPNRVTLFGESAGSSSISLHTHSPLSKGLYSAVIMQSGTSVTPWAVSEDRGNVRKTALEVGKLAGCDAEDTQQLVDCLLDVPAEGLVNASQKFSAETVGDTEIRLIGPAFDGYFFPEAPSTLIEKRSFNAGNINILAGYTADEGTMIMSFIYGNATEKPHVNASEYESYMAMFKIKQAVQPLERDALELVYFDDSIIADPNPNYFDVAVKIFGDCYFTCPHDKYLRAALEAEIGPVYAYYFNHHPSKSAFNTPWTGACHGDDLFFFGLHWVPNEFNLTDTEVEMTVKIIKYWTNFAKTGNPNMASEDEVSSAPEDKILDWPQYTLDNRMFKELSPEMKNIPDPRRATCRVWNDFLPKLEAALADSGQCQESKSCKSHWVEEGQESCSDDSKP